MFRKVSAPKRPVSKVTQEVIMSVSKTPSLTFLHPDMGASRVTTRDGTLCGLRAWWGTCHPPGPAEEGPRQRAEAGRWAAAPFPPSDTAEDHWPFHGFSPTAQLRTSNTLTRVRSRVHAHSRNRERRSLTYILQTLHVSKTALYFLIFI